MPGPFPFKQILAADPSSPAMSARNGEVLLFAPGDATMTPLVIWDLSHTIQLPNPVTVNDLGFGPAFIHDTLDQVAWSGGGLNGTFESYRGMKDAATAAEASSEASASSSAQSAQSALDAADNAATAAAAGVQAQLAATAQEATDAKTAAQQAAQLVNAPADTVTAALVGNPATATGAALSAAVDTRVRTPVANGQQPVRGMSRGYNARINRKSTVREASLATNGARTWTFPALLPSPGNNTVSPVVLMTFTARANTGGTFHISEVRGINGQNGSPVLRLGTVTHYMGSLFNTSGTVNVVLSNTTVNAAGDVSLTLTNYATDTYRIIAEVTTLNALVPSNAPTYGSDFYAWWGDSLTVGGATTVWGTLAGLSGVPVLNRGVSGDSSVHIAARAMGLPSKLTTPVTLPFSGSVPVSIDTDRLPTPDFARLARIGGRAGTLTQSAGVRVFTPTTPGPAVTLPAGTPVYYPDADASSEMVEIVWAGTNDPATVATPDVVVANVLSIVQRNKRGQVLVLGALGPSENVIGSTEHTHTLAVNTALGNMFGPTFLDIWAYLKSSGLADAGITPTAQDNTDLANGITPSSLRSDHLHLNNTAYGLVGTQSWNRLVSLGFTL